MREDERLVLADGLKIRLLGVKERADTREKAMQFLEEKTRGQKVFLRFGSIKHDEQNILLCYVYLQNKTFVNAHLIRKGLADIDTSVESKFRADLLKSGKEPHGEGMDQR